MSNELQQQPKFSVFINSKGTQQAIMNTLQDVSRTKKFTAAIVSAVTMNPSLAECNQATILSGALLGESLNLSPSPQLGQYHLVPFKDKNKGKVATFIVGYKGYLTMAIRSGYYKNINVMEVREGEYQGINSESGEPIISFISDDEERLSKPVIGYYAYIKLVSGFEKSMYWSKTKMMNHADTYSAAFSKESYKKLQEGKIPPQDLWKYSSFWYKSFDDMALKTMLRQILSKWGVLSTEMQEMFVKDETTGDNKNDRNYIEADFKEDNISSVNENQKQEVGKKELDIPQKPSPTTKVEKQIGPNNSDDSPYSTSMPFENENTDTKEEPEADPYEFMNKYLK